MPERNQQAKRFLRQLMLKRYKLLLQKLQQAYSLNDTQMDLLRTKILHIDWFEFDSIKA